VSSKKSPGAAEGKIIIKDNFDDKLPPDILKHLAENEHLLDTHILLWWLSDDPKLSTKAKEIILNPKIHSL
jgi:hypothetical protein